MGISLAMGVVRKQDIRVALVRLNRDMLIPLEGERTPISGA